MNGAQPSRLAPLSVRLSREERARLESAAGNLPLGAYIKSRIFADGAPPKLARTRNPVREQRALAQVLARLGASHIAHNLNQLARAASSGSLDCDEGTKALITAAQSDIAVMRDLLVRALGLNALPSCRSKRVSTARGRAPGNDEMRRSSSPSRMRASTKATILSRRCAIPAWNWIWIGMIDRIRSRIGPPTPRSASGPRAAAATALRPNRINCRTMRRHRCTHNRRSSLAR